MSKLFFFAAIDVLALLSCSTHPYEPENSAKDFIRDYFKPDQRYRLLETTIEAAYTKIVLEKEPSDSLSHSVIWENPSDVHLNDSKRFNENYFRFSFSIHYHGNLFRKETMLVFVKRDESAWKISDYRFTQESNE
jgi:hypothetical protein